MPEAQTPANVTAKAGAEPDPTVLTTQALWREIAHSNELENQKIRGIEKAIEVAHTDMVRFPTEIDLRTGSLKELIMLKIAEIDKSAVILKEFMVMRLDDIYKLKQERFENIDKHFASIEITRLEHKADTKLAVDAALIAAEKAVTKQNETIIASITKSEAATTKQIDAQGLLIANSTNSLDSKINDLKERFLKLEGQSNGPSTETQKLLIRLAELEANNNRSAGAGMPDEFMRRLVLLETSKNQIQGSGDGKKDFWGYIIGGIGLLSTILTIVILLMRNFKG